MKKYNLFLRSQTICILFLNLHLSVIASEQLSESTDRQISPNLSNSKIYNFFNNVYEHFKKPKAIPQPEDPYIEEREAPTNSREVILRLKKEIKGNNVEAMYELGLLYQAMKNYKQALQWFQQASLAGHYLAVYRQGQMYLYGQGTKINYEKATELFKDSVENGNISNSMYALGKMYLYGNGVDQNSQEAFYWFQRAVDNGHFLAPYELGKMYRYGIGIDQNFQVAFQLFKKSAEKNNYKSMYELGKMYRYGDGITQNYNEALQWFSRAVDNGSHTDAMNELGKMYKYGKGTDQNFQVAFQLFKKSAEKDNYNSMYELGKIYLYGDGITQNYNEALKWFLRAVEGNHYMAMYKIGRMYLYGNGVTQNYDTAIEWLMRSSEKGNRYAKTLLFTIQKDEYWQNHHRKNTLKNCSKSFLNKITQNF